jgi:hypothetical protein
MFLLFKRLKTFVFFFLEVEGFCSTLKEVECFYFCFERLKIHVFVFQEVEDFFFFLGG